MDDYIWFTCDQKSCLPSLYIDLTIFDWFNRLLKYNKFSKLIENVWDIKLNNVEFNELNVKLVQFKSLDTSDTYYTKDMFDGLKKFIQEILIETKICMPWLPFKNLYCSQDEYEIRMADFKERGLCDAIVEVKDYYLNWIDQTPLKLFRFEDDAFMNYKDILSNCIYKIKYPVYISCAYPWHQSWYINYFSYDTDFLAIDICASEWKRMDMLQSFNIFDIMSLDLALCDANDYLNAYIQRSFLREFRFIKNLHTTNKFEQFDLERYLFDKKRYDSVDIDLYLLFLYSYGNNLKFINWSDRNIKNINEIKIYFIMILRNMLPNVTIQKNNFITLKSYTVKPIRIINSISRSKYGNIILDISNYKQFSAKMLNKLLKLTQIQRIEINVDLLTKFDVQQETLTEVEYLLGLKTIYLYSKNGGNVHNIESILKYLGRFNVSDITLGLFLIINNCVIYDYGIFKGLKTFAIAFQNMDISLTDLRTFCNQELNLLKLYFVDCTKFSDHHLIELLENHLIIKRLYIEGAHSVTINFYFMYAELQLRSKKFVHFKLGYVVPIISMKSYGMFQNLTFLRNESDGKIETRNNFNDPVDIFDLFYDSDQNSDRDLYEFYT